MSDAEIQELERRIREGDTDAWPLLDAALARAGRPPRRVFEVYSVTGEYADRSETTFSPAFASRSDAVKFMDRLAVERDWESWVRDEQDDESYRVSDGHGTMRVIEAEVVPPGGEALGRCPWRHQRAHDCPKRDGHP